MIAAGLVPLGAEPLEEDLRDVMGMLVQTGRVMPVDKWCDEEVRAKSARGFAALM